MRKGIYHLPSGLELLFGAVLVLLVGIWGFKTEDFILAALAYAAVLLGFNDTFFSRGIRKAIRDIKHNGLVLLLIAIIAALLTIWKVSGESICFISVLVAFLLYQWDSRVLAGMALICLASCPVLLIFGFEADAEMFAVWAYYFLVMTVVLQIVEYKRYPDRFREKGSAKSILDLRTPNTPKS